MLHDEVILSPIRRRSSAKLYQWLEPHLFHKWETPFPIFITFLLQVLPASGLNGQRQHAEEGCEKQRTRSVNGRSGVRGAGVDSNDGSAKTRDSVEETRYSRSSATIRRGENFWGVRVEHTVHDVLKEGFE
jgi:hypothetical protein